MKVWSNRNQSGISLTSLIFLLAIIGFVGVLALRIVPSVTEYMAVKKAIAAARVAGVTPQEIRTAFDRHAEIAYIRSISGKDLDIGKDNEVSFSYQKIIHLAGPASLVLDYEGSTSANPAARKAE
jgi:hypothetical protein